MLGLFAIADEFVLIVFGTKWMPATFLIKVLSIVGLMQSIGSTVGSIYLAKGRTDWMFRWGIFSSVIAVSAIVIGLRWGINGVAVCYAIATLLLIYPNFAIPFRLIDLRFTDFVLNLKKETATSLIMFFIVMTSVTIQRHYLFSREIILISSIIIGVMSYFVAVTVFNKSTYKELKNHTFSRGE